MLWRPTTDITGKPVSVQVGNYRISDTERQNQYSIAYIQAISSVAGYSVEEIRVDQDSVDVTLTQRGDRESDGEEYPLREGLKIQLKCTHQHQPRNGLIHFPLSRKNYNDLRRLRVVATRLLIVLYTPPGFENFIQERDNDTILANTAHWLSLKGMPTIPAGQNSVTVRVPIAQRFTTTWLGKAMDCIATVEADMQIDSFFGVGL